MMHYEYFCMGNLLSLTMYAYPSDVDYEGIAKTPE